MDALVAVFALNVVKEMGTCVMLCPLPFMTSMTGNRFGLDSGPFHFHVLFDIHDIPVAAVTGKGTMDGLGKRSLADLLSVTTKAFRVVNALIAELSIFGGELFSLLPGFGRFHSPDRFGYRGRFRVLLLRFRFRCPEGAKSQDEESRNGDKNKD